MTVMNNPISQALHLHSLHHHYIWFYPYYLVLCFTSFMFPLNYACGFFPFFFFLGVEIFSCYCLLQ